MNTYTEKKGEEYSTGYAPSSSYEGRKSSLADVSADEIIESIEQDEFQPQTFRQLGRE